MHGTMPAMAKKQPMRHRLKLLAFRNLMTGGASAGHDVLQGIGVDEAPSTAGHGSPQVLPGPPPKLSMAELERLKKQQEKIAKKAHKAHKKVNRASYQLSDCSVLTPPTWRPLTSINLATLVLTWTPSTVLQGALLVPEG